MALPFKDMTAFDFSGVVFSQFPPDTLESQARMKIEMSIMDSVEKDIADYRKQYIDGHTWTKEQQEDWDQFFKDWRESECVISPWTIHMFFFRQRMSEIESMKPWDVESQVMDEYPGQFYPHYKINITNPNAKQFSDEDSVIIHQDGRIEHKPKSEEEWEKIESKHTNEMEKLQLSLTLQKNDGQGADASKNHYNLVFFGNILDEI